MYSKSFEMKRQQTYMGWSFNDGWMRDTTLVYDNSLSLMQWNCKYSITKQGAWIILHCLQYTLTPQYQACGKQSACDIKVMYNVNMDVW